MWGVYSFRCWSTYRGRYSDGELERWRHHRQRPWDAWPSVPNRISCKCEQQTVGAGGQHLTPG